MVEEAESFSFYSLTHKFDDPMPTRLKYDLIRQHVSLLDSGLVTLGKNRSSLIPLFCSDLFCMYHCAVPRIRAQFLCCFLY